MTVGNTGSALSTDIELYAPAPSSTPSFGITLTLAFSNIGSVQTLTPGDLGTQNVNLGSLTIVSSTPLPTVCQCLVRHSLVWPVSA